jgi:hypothetical protein
MSSLEPLTRSIQLRSCTWRLVPVVLAVPLMLLAAGCGSSGPTGGSSQGAAGGPVAAAYDYAHCMRSHGVSSFPDPHVSTGPGHTEISQEAAPVSTGQAPVFRAAEHACRGILRAINIQRSQGPGARVLLAFAKCLRAHGLPDFPDPDRNGRITRTMLSAAGIDLHAPVFLSAARSCIGVTHGAITAADIHAAVTGPH